jgi:copper(I)-binding protein
MIALRLGSALVFTVAMSATTVACRGSESRAASGRYAREGIVVTGIVAPAPVVVGKPEESTMAVYLTLRNEGDRADTLTRVESSAGEAALHGNMDHGGTSMMMPVPALAVPAHGEVRLAPGGMHVMLERLQRQIAVGDSVSLTLVFSHAGPLPVSARVVRYGELDEALRSAAPEK